MAPISLPLSSAEFRSQFLSFFTLDPDLELPELYALLSKHSFVIEETRHDLAQQVRRKKKRAEWLVPQSALDQLGASYFGNESVSGGAKVKRGSTIESTPVRKSENDDDGSDADRGQSGLAKVEINLVTDSDSDSDSAEVDLDTDSDSDDDSDGEKESAAINLDSDSDSAAINLDTDSETADDEIEGVIKKLTTLKRTFSGAFNNDPAPEVISASPAKQQSPRKYAAKKAAAEALTTPLVQKLAGRIFVKPLTGIGSKGERIEGEKAVKDHEIAMKSMRESANEFLLGVQLQPKQEYKVGDCVVVKGRDYDATQPLSNLRYGRITRLSTKLSKTKVHVLWFMHGADIEVLKELANPKELFLVSDCSKVRLKKILTKIRVDYRGNSTTGNPNSGFISEEYTDGDHYFYRQQYNSNGHMFTKAPEQLSCISCERRETEAQAHQLSMLDEGINGRINSFRYQRKDYEVLDFVYFGNFGPNGDHKNKIPYRIGQIKKIKVLDSSKEALQPEDLIIFMEVYERSDRFHPGWSVDADAKHTVRDERRLFRTRTTEKVKLANLDGCCFVKHVEHIGDLNAYKDMDDTFWVADQLIPFRDPEDVMPLPAEEVKYSKASIKSLRLRKQRADQFKKYGTPLWTMDVFSGAGGLSRGFHESGVAGTTYAIELDRAAFLTIQKNNPNFLALNQDANALLRWAVMNEAGLDPQEMMDIKGHKMPRMPKVGTICLIIGGSPCPGFSDLNRRKSPDYPTNLLLAVYLSYVELYRPRYFLLENVAGIWYTPLGCNKELKHGGAKFIFSVLTALGYQCQIAILQAAEYGCPQSRKRVIVWASLPGYGLPKFPQPSHVFSGRSGGTNFHRERKSAPHFPITVGDALTDLPKFEWKNCHKELEETNEQRIDREARGKKGIAQLPTLKSNGFVGFKEQPYASKLPLSEYQRRMRKGVSSEKLHNHITGIPSELTCERVCNVPLEVKADHRSIPAKLLDGRGTCEAGEYGRLGFEDQFKIATTQISRWNLHPSQHRTFTIRENARVQGFADDVIWDTDIMTITDIHKQIGNAVPVPLAVALAKGLLDGLMDKLEAESHGVIKSEFKLVEDFSETEIEQRQTKTEETEASRFGKQHTGRSGGSINKAIYIIDDSDSD